MIESVNNETIKEYAKLKTKKYRDETGLFIVEGEHLVEEAEKCGLVVKKYYLNKDVSENVMKKLSCLTNPPRVLAICKKPNNTSIIGNVLVLDNIQDPGNLGTIIRMSVAFNIDTILVSKDTVDYTNDKVVRASEGMVFHTNIVVGDIMYELEKLKGSGYAIYTTDVRTGKNLPNVIVANKFALIMGNEGNGVRDNIAAIANEKINIPISDRCESLNVAVATAIILYEFNKK